jgi:hypothetical protein
VVSIAQQGLARAVSTTFAQPSRSVAFMARPRVYEENRVTTALRLPESLHDRLRDQADRRDVSVNLLATKAIRDYLEQLERTTPEG